MTFVAKVKKKSKGIFRPISVASLIIYPIRLKIVNLSEF
jgi:hypothetical protein